MVLTLVGETTVMSSWLSFVLNLNGWGCDGAGWGVGWYWLGGIYLCIIGCCWLKLKPWNGLKLDCPAPIMIPTCEDTIF